MEDGERRSQPHSVEYDWLDPDLTRNTRGRYIPIFPVVLITTTPHVPTRFFYLNLIWYLFEYINQ